jgi:dihydroflavonol-4-reductase
VHIAVTGATGYLGAHAVDVLRRDGHGVRALLHPADTGRPLATYGLPDDLPTVEGDVADPTAVAELLTGCDALLHLAGIVAVDNRREDLMWRVNVEATEQLLTAAVDRGLDPVVHVSSYVALFPSPTGVIDPDTPTAAGRSAYGRTKAAADRFTRSLQATGAPVTVLYPSSLVGPALGERPGIAAEGWAPLLRSRSTVTFRGHMPLIDVRDVADLLAAAMVPGRGPRRLPCGGAFLAFDDVLDAVEAGLDRPTRRVRIGPRVFRGLGRAFDAAARVLPLPPVFSYEAAWLLTTGQPTDDTAALAVLGRSWRDARAGLTEAIRSARG